MKIKSAKAKGQRAANEVRASLLSAFPGFGAADIMVTPASVPGVDLRHSPFAQAFFPFAVEVKNCEKLNIHQAMAQAEAHAARSPGLMPLVIFRRNREVLRAVLHWDHLLQLVVRSSRLKNPGSAGIEPPPAKLRMLEEFVGMLS